MARHRVLIAVAVVFDGNYYEPDELVPETWRWIDSALEDRDDLESAEMLASLVLDDPEAKVMIKFDGNPGAVDDHWAPVECTCDSEDHTHDSGCPQYPATPDLSETEQSMLRFALDQAAEELSLGQGLTDSDQGCLDRLRLLAGDRS